MTAENFPAEVEFESESPASSTVRVSQTQKEKLSEKSEESDYFQVSIDDEPEELLSAPADWEENSEEGTENYLLTDKETEVNRELQKTTAETNQANDQVKVNKVNAESQMSDFENQVQPVAVQKNEIKQSSPVEPEAEVEVAQENEADREYFQKYKKLYEKFSPQNHEEIMMQVEKMTVPYLDNKSAQIANSTTETKFKKELEPLIAQEHNEGIQHGNSENEGLEKKQELPSLKDLLKELEGERLSGEDVSEEMDEKAIDDLIYRITHDY